jgi:hypothetical protein
VLTVLHTGGFGSGASQVAPGGHAGAASPEHSSRVCFRQTMSVSQSLSLSQGSATQASVVAAQGGQSLPGAQAMAGHPACTSSQA